MESLRRLRGARAFSIPAVAGLALAIGAATAVFSVFSAMLLASLGVKDPARVVTVWATDPAHGQQNVELCYADYIDWRKAGSPLADLALASSVNLDFPLPSQGMPENVDGTIVTGNFFDVLGVRPYAGRLLQPSDDVPGAPFRVVLSHRLWSTRFGADPRIVGRQLGSGDNAVEVVGIAPPEFDFPRDVAMWAPLHAGFSTVEQTPTLRVFRSVARLRAGVGVNGAQAALTVIAKNAQDERSAGAGRYGVLVTPLLDEIYGAARPAIQILLAAVMLVLLIACANAANLLLARAAGRAREIAVRTALGAGRGRIVRLLLEESAVLAAVAGALGIALAAAGVRLLVRLAPEEVPRVAQASLDLPVLAFSMAVTAATVFLFGLAPAWVASRRDPAEALQHAGARFAGSRAQSRFRRVLIAGEVGLSAVLLIGAGLLVRSFANLAAVDPGFRPDHILTFRLTTQGTNQEARRALYSQVLERLRSLPGVESAGAVLIRPLSGAVGWDTTYRAEGQSTEQAKGNLNGNYEAISPQYFDTMRIRLLAGRDFTNADNHLAPGVVILSQATARRHWAAGEAVGKRILLGGSAQPQWLTVVGVVSDVRYREWEASRPDFYVPYLQRAQHRTDFVIRTHGDPLSLANAVRRTVFEIRRDQPVSNLTTMDALVDRALGRARFNTLALAALAAAALLLTAIGIYGVLSFLVVQRTAEIAVRVALGATPLNIAWHITAAALRLVLAGLAAGVAAAALIRGAVATQLFGVSPIDPAAWSGAVLLLLAIAAAACVIPALRAAGVQPARALRSE